jgi:hypothetical protein
MAACNGVCVKTVKKYNEVHLLSFMNEKVKDANAMDAQH